MKRLIEMKQSQDVWIETKSSLRLDCYSEVILIYTVGEVHS